MRIPGCRRPLCASPAVYKRRPKQHHAFFSFHDISTGARYCQARVGSPIRHTPPKNSWIAQRSCPSSYDNTSRRHRSIVTMTSKLVPAEPSKVMVIRNVTPNIVTLSLPFLRFGLIRIGGRGTIARLSSGALAVFSPVALTPEVEQVVESLGGNVGYLIAPDFEHHIFLSDWHDAFPKALVVGVEGLPEKRAANPAITHKVPFSTVFTALNKADSSISEEFDKDFDYEYVDAHPNKELVFVYKPDKILIQADLLFNLPATEQYSKTGEPANKGLLTKFFIAFSSTQSGATWPKRLKWLMSGKDREGWNKSVRRIASWDFETLIPCHGDVIEGNGKEVFKEAFSWHLEDKKSQD